MKLKRIISKQILLITFLLLFTLNLSNLLVSSVAQETQNFEGQQLILTPTGAGSYTELVDIEGFSGPYFSENWQYAVSADGKYLKTDSQKETDTYKLSNHDSSKNYGSIYSIDIVVTYSSIGQRQGFSGAVYIDDNLYTTEKQEISSISDGDLHFIITSNPITEKPWTWDDIDNLEAGATLYRSALTSASPYLDKLSVIVNYGLDITIITDPVGCNVSLDSTTIISDSNGAIITGITPFTIWNVTVSKQYYYPKTETISINNTNVQTTISLTQSYYKLTITTIDSVKIRF